MVFPRSRWRSDQPGPWVTGPLALPHNGWTGAGQEVAPGCIIVRERQPWRVLEVNERPEDLWPEGLEQWWQRLVADQEEYDRLRLAGVPHEWGSPREEKPPLVRAEWPARPAVMILQPVGQPKAELRHIMAKVHLEWQILPEHYAVCRACNELPPCRHQETEATVDQAMGEAERLMAIPPGACLGCGKAISSRMKSVRYPGPNLWRPDWGNDSAVFHLRDQARGYDCTNGSYRYSRQWEAAGLNVLVPQLPEGQN